MFFYSEQEAQQTSPIVTEGLQLHLDAGDTNSYPGTGTTWYDLSGNGYNGTLVNGVSYSSENGGTFVFDGVDDYVNTGLYNTEFTSLNYSMEVIFNSNTITNGTFNVLIGQRSDNDYKALGGIWIESRNAWTGNYLSNYGIVAFASQNDNSINKSAPGSIIDNTWYHVTLVSTATNTKLYINGQLISDIVRTGVLDTSSPGTFGVGNFGVSQAGGPQYTDYLSNQKISIARVYNKSLSDTEVQQNFNAIKDRFGL